MIITNHRLELKFPVNMTLSDEEFYLFCLENRNLKFEKTKDGNIVVMTPTGGNTGSRNSEVNAELIFWNRQNQYGKVFDSSTGFRLPDGSMLAPDASVIAQSRWDTLSDDEKDKFPPLCPEFVIELKSKSDHLPTLQAKMKDWLNNGVQLGWLIDPENETVYIYQPNQAVQTMTGFGQTLSADVVLPGFGLDLKVLR